MTETVVVYTTHEDAAGAGADLGTQISAAFGGAAPDAVVVFASSRYAYQALLESLSAACRPAVLVGSSSAGEFTHRDRGDGQACALAIRSTAMQFTAGVATHLSRDRGAAAAALVAPFRGLRGHEFPYRTALVMTDALAGHADDLLEQLTLATSGMYEFVGGGAGDDADFKRTHVFHGTDAVTDAAVALEILSTKPVGVGVSHGWTPAGEPLRVTAAEGMRIVSLNGLPAADAFEAHAEETGQAFDRADPLPFFLHNILGIDAPGGFRLRVPLAVLDDGSVACAAEVPVGARVCVMKTTADSAIGAAAAATQTALSRLGGHRPGVALFFDCVATRLRLGDVFGFELNAVSDLLGGAPFAGCNTYGQIARAEGQFGGFHNCTAVVCVLPG